MNDLGLGIVISMKDMFTRNAARVQGAMTSLDATVAAASGRMTRNMDRIQKGTMMIGAGLALLAVPSAVVASTGATQKALGEMASLGTKDLRALELAAQDFTNQWAGASKAEFIGAAYDVKSALSGLSDQAVGTFAGMAALTAKATKASIQEMVGTFTTGYGIFKPIMAEMDDMQWARAFSGAMAQTVAAFKTTGPQMAEAIKNVGATAAASNIPLQEQLAILGQLQTTMPGSEAGTLYKAFIMKAAEAGDELGLSLVGASGQLKGILPVLRELKSKFPDLSQAAAQVQIKKAFGSDEAVKFVLQMSAGLEALEGNIAGIEKAMKRGTAVTQEMARAMNMDIGSQWALVRQRLMNLFEILGGALLPVVTPVIQGVSMMILFFQKLAAAAPVLTRGVLTLAMALGGLLVAAGGALAAAGSIGLVLPAIEAGLAAMGTTLAGVGAAAAAAAWPVTLAVGGIILAAVLLRRAWSSNFAGIRSMLTGFGRNVGLVFEGVHTLVKSLRDGVGQMPAELAQKLQAAGLMGLVTTLFRIYHRARELGAGFTQTFGHALGRVRSIMEPAVHSLLTALGALGAAVLSVFKALGLISTAADSASLRGLGSAIGTVLGVVLQVGALILRLIVTPLAWIVRALALVARAAGWTLGIIVAGFIDAAKFIYKFFLPMRLLVHAMVAAGRIIYGVWQILSGDGSLLDGLKAIGRAVLDFLLEPWRWARDVASGLWKGVSGVVRGAGQLFTWLGGVIQRIFMNLPVVRFVRFALKGMRAWLSSDRSFFVAGRDVMRQLARGIGSMAALPMSILRAMMRKISGIFTGMHGGALGQGMMRGLMHGLMRIVSEPLEGLRTLVRRFLDLVQGIWQRLCAIGQIVLGVFGSGRSVFSGVVSAARVMANGLGRIAGGIVRVWGWAFALIREAGGAAFSGMRQRAAGVWNAMHSGLSIAGDWADGVWKKIKSVSGGFWGSVKSAAAQTLGEVRPGMPLQRAASNAHQQTSLILAPQIDTRLIPAVFRAALLLTPVLVSAVPTPAATSISGVIAQPTHMPQAMAAQQPLTPAMTAMPVPALEIEGTLPGPQDRTEPNESARQPVETQGRRVDPSPLLMHANRPWTDTNTANGGGAPETLRPLIETLIAKLDALAERPIDLSVTTKIDGRQVAQAVYKDMRERKIRDYQTL